MDLDGGNQKRVVTGVGNSILLDFHYTEGRVYWADKKTGVIYKAAMDGTQRQVHPHTTSSPSKKCIALKKETECNITVSI
jgi:hypothetical protein